MNDYFPDWRPAYPWSLEHIGLPAFLALAAVLVLFTIWTYLGHPQATRRRVFIVLVLRLAALFVALITAVRPMLGVYENPKVPSILVVGVDLSESMTTPDGIGDRPRAETVRRTLEKCQPKFDELLEKHGVTTVVYRFGSPDFNEATARYDPGFPADAKRSDYGVYLLRTFERWQADRVRMHLLIGDGQDNGQTFAPTTEAARWGRRGAPIHTFLVGRESSDTKSRDIIAQSAEGPSSAPIKTTVEITTRVFAYGFAGNKVTARVFLNDKPVATEEFTLASERGEDGKGNRLKIPIRLPEQRGEYKVRVQIGVPDKDDQIVALPGEVSPINNVAHTYITVTKEGVRLLVVDQLRDELTGIRDALRGERRFDVYEVYRQRGIAPTGPELELLDLEKNAYDVVIIGNVRGADLPKQFLDKLTELAKKGLGVMFLGGEDGFDGLPADLLPVTPGRLIDDLDEMSGAPKSTYPAVPAGPGLDKMFRPPIKKRADDNVWDKTQWDRLNGSRSGIRLSGFKSLALTPEQRNLYTVYAWTTTDPGTDPLAGTPFNGENPASQPLLVGTKSGDKNAPRWLAFGAYDTYQWRVFGQLHDPKSDVGMRMHEQFWRQCVLWLAKQDDEESDLFVRPEKRLLKAGDEQTVRVGVKLPDKVDDTTAPLTVKIVPLKEGQQEPTPEEIAQQPPLTVLADDRSELEGRKVLMRPSKPGEYYVVATSTKKDAKGVDLKGTAKFIVEPEWSDEMLRVNANPQFLKDLSAASGGEALALEDLPEFLDRYLKKLDDPTANEATKKPRYLPDWHRNRSRTFLTIWLVVFVLLLGTEWGLRRLWGMV